LEAVAGALEAGFLSAALGAILVICEELKLGRNCRWLRRQMDLATVDALMVAGRDCGWIVEEQLCWKKSEDREGAVTFL
jgi:hypothetical protein